MSNLINFIDIETTGTNEPDHRIIEACVQLYDATTEALVVGFVWRCNPMRKIDVKAQKVHGIKLDDLAKEPTWDIVAPEIRSAIERSDVGMIVAHNGDDFDFDFLDREFRRIGIFCKFPTRFDTMKQARWATANGKLPKLGELARSLDVEYDPALAHSADYDVSVMAKCFFEGRRLGAYAA